MSKRRNAGTRQRVRLFGAGNERVRPYAERPGGVPLYIQLIRLSTTHLLTGASKCMECGAARGGQEGHGGRGPARPAAGNSRISRQYRGRYEYDTAAGHRARSPQHPSRCNPRAVRPSTTLGALPSPRRPPPTRHVGAVVRDPRLTRARPLFSTRWSFVDAFLFVIPFVIPLPLFVAHRRAPRVADAVIVGPRIAADKTGRGIVRRARRRVEITIESRDDGRASNMRAFLS